MKEGFPIGFAPVSLDANTTMPILVERVRRYINHDQRRVPSAWLLPQWDADQMKQYGTVVVAKTNAIAGLLRPPIDSLPQNEITEKFKRGVFCGFVVGRALHPKLASVSFAMQQLVNEVGTIVDEDPVKSAQRVQIYLEQVANESFTKIVGLNSVWDSVIEAEPILGDEQTRPYSRLGFGMGALVYHEAAGHQLVQEIEQEIAALNSASDTAIIEAITQGEPPTE